MVFNQRRSKQVQGVIILQLVIILLGVTPVTVLSFDHIVSDNLFKRSMAQASTPNLTRFVQSGSLEFRDINTDDPDLIWSQVLGGAESEICWSLVECSSGGFVTVGKTESYGAGGQDVWLIRFDSHGSYMWDTTFGGVGEDIGRDIVECAGGGFIIVGHTTSFSTGSGDEYDLWLIRIDASGNLLWNRTFGGEEEEKGWAVVECSGGGFAVAGHTDSGLTGSRDGYLVRVDADGNLLFNQSYGGYDEDVFRDLIEVSGGFVLAGYTTIDSATDGWWMRTDDLGSGIAASTLHYAGVAQYIYSVIQPSGGGYIVAGMNIFSKLRDDGTLEWRKIPPGSVGGDTSVVECTKGGFALCGYSSGKGAIIRTDANGNYLWGETYDASGGAGTSALYGLIESSDGNFTCTGYADLRSNHDVWLAKAPDVDIWWDEEPRDQIVYWLDSFRYDLDASAWGGISTWWLDDTENFIIDDDGVITNTTAVAEEVWHWLEVTVNDTNGNTLVGSFNVIFLSFPPPDEYWPNPVDILIPVALFLLILLIIGVLVMKARTDNEPEPLARERRRRRVTRRVTTPDPAEIQTYPIPGMPVAEEPEDPSIEGRLATPSRFRCMECGEFITGGKDVCPECGAKQVRCMVCQQFIGQEELYIMCPHCEQLAHRAHLLEWVKIKGICPYCKEKLRRSDIG